jgi:hypothetical protein
MKYILYIFICSLIFSCSSQKSKKTKSYTEKELEKSILVGDFLFVENKDNDSLPKKIIIKKDEPKFNPKINKDSLFQVIINKIHPSQVEGLTKTYEEGNEVSREFLLMMFSMPESSRNEQINNLKVNENNIKKLIKEYSSLVPDSLTVFIEFNPKDIILSTNKSIDLRIYSNKKSKNSGIELDFQEWNLQYNSEVLLEQIKILGWNEKTLINIENLLDNAKCRSIENGKISTVGFARSGMGKYSYKFFEEDLSEKEQAEFNDGCSYIYYERNIVLEFGGGAVGRQCFEKD